MSDDNVVSFKQDGTREMLKKILQAYDSGRVSSVVVIAQGYDEKAEAQVVLPYVSDETKIRDLTFASAILSGYVQNVANLIMAAGTKRDA